MSTESRIVYTAPRRYCTVLKVRYGLRVSAPKACKLMQLTDYLRPRWIHQTRPHSDLQRRSSFLRICRLSNHFSRIANLMGLLVTVMGSFNTILIYLGILKCAIWPQRCSCNSSGDTSAPSEAITQALAAMGERPFGEKLSVRVGDLGVVAEQSMPTKISNCVIAFLRSKPT